MAEIWHRQPNESAKAYQAFLYYRNMPSDERTIPKAYNTFRQDIGKEKRSHAYWWNRWSAKFNWAERIRAFDSKREKEALIEHIRKRREEIETFIEKDVEIARGVQQVTFDRLSAIIESPGDLDAHELRQLTMAYDTARSWLKDLLGILDDEAKTLDEIARNQNGNGIQQEQLAA